MKPSTTVPPLVPVNTLGSAYSFSLSQYSLAQFIRSLSNASALGYCAVLDVEIQAAMLYDLWYIKQLSVRALLCHGKL